MRHDVRTDLQSWRLSPGEVKDSGFQNVVLLGMGGSSLGPEVVRQTMGSSHGLSLRINTLDSTVPAWVQRSYRSGRPGPDPVHRVLQVGWYHGDAVILCPLQEASRGAGGAGPRRRELRSPITDAGTPLERLGLDHGFPSGLPQPGGHRWTLFGPVLLRAGLGIPSGT